MHPALIILVVVFGVHVTNLIGRDRIQAAILPFYTRLFHSTDLKAQRQLKQTLFDTRQQLNKTSSQDEFAKWAKLRRSVDKMIAQLEACNSRLASASSTLAILLRIFLFFTTTLFPFVLTFYFGKTPMFFLPPSGSSAATTKPARIAPGGFTIPNSPYHAWDLANETYLGPIGWLLSMTAAPRGSVSAGMWSTVCTRVALLLTNRLREAFVALATVLSSRPSSTRTTEKAEPEGRGTAKEKDHGATTASAPGMSERTPATRKRPTAGQVAE